MTFVGLEIGHLDLYEFSHFIMGDSVSTHRTYEVERKAGEKIVDCEGKATWEARVSN